MKNNKRKYSFFLFMGVFFNRLLVSGILWFFIYWIIWLLFCHYNNWTLKDVSFFNTTYVIGWIIFNFISMPTASKLYKSYWGNFIPAYYTIGKIGFFCFIVLLLLNINILIILILIAIICFCGGPI